MAGPFLPHMDPNYKFWFNHYSWWYFQGNASHGTTYRPPTEPRMTRIAFSLAGLIVHDRLSKEDSELLKNAPVKVFDFSATDNDVPAMMEALSSQTQIVKLQDIPFYVARPIPPNQFIVLNALFQPQPKEVFDAFSQFVDAGGRSLVFHSATHLVARKIASAPPSTVVQTRLRISPDAESKSWFSDYKPNQLIDVEYFRYPLNVVDAVSSRVTHLQENVKVFTQIYTPEVDPLMAQFPHGRGSVYVWVSRMFLPKSEIEIKTPSQEGKNASKAEGKENGVKTENGEKETAEPPKKKKKDTKQNLHDRLQPKRRVSREEWMAYLKAMGASHTTEVAWECAMGAGWEEAYDWVRRFMPSMWALAQLMVKEQKELLQLFGTQDPQTYLTQQEQSYSQPPQQDNGENQEEAPPHHDEHQQGFEMQQ